MQKTSLKERDKKGKDLGTSQQGSEVLLSCPGYSGSAMVETAPPPSLRPRIVLVVLVAFNRGAKGGKAGECRDDLRHRFCDNDKIYRQDLSPPARESAFSFCIFDPLKKGICHRWLRSLH